MVARVSGGGRGRGMGWRRFRYGGLRVWAKIGDVLWGMAGLQGETGKVWGCGTRVTGWDKGSSEAGRGLRGGRGVCVWRGGD